MEQGFRLWANPSSPHAEGRKARAALEDARDRVKRALGWDGEVIFTSGASEAAALARGYARADEQMLSAVEHDATMNPVYGAKIIRTELAVGHDGELRADQLENVLRQTKAHGEIALAIVQDVNSETGNRQDLQGICDSLHAIGGLVLADCAQSAGKLGLPDADMMIVSAHKFGGPIGVGALLVRDFGMMDAPGGQERGYRRGTENLPGVLGMAAALEACSDPYVDPEVLAPLENLADACRKLGGTWLSDHLSCRTPFIRAIAMPNIGASAQVMRFDIAGIAVSQGSACSSGAMKISRVLEAMQVEPDIAANTIRVSIGWNTTKAEVERFCEVWLDMARSV